MQAMKIKTLKEIIKNLDPNLTIVVASCNEDIENLELADEECVMLIAFKDLTQRR